MKDIDEFERVAQSLIEAVENNHKKKNIQKLKALMIVDKKAFVKYFKKVTGATNWDLPDIIYSFS